MTEEKKSERLEVRLGFQEKQVFVDACEVRGDTPSSALRRFIRGYSRRADAAILATFWRFKLKRYSRPALGAAIAFIIVIGSLAAGTYGFNKVDEDALFALRDLNEDGLLDASELGLPPMMDDVPSGVLLVLDLDQSGTLSRQEFKAKGRMAYIIQGPVDAVVNTRDIPAVHHRAIKNKKAAPKSGLSNLDVSLR